MKALPGDPFTNEKALPIEVIHALKKQYLLDRNLSEQYIHFIKKLCLEGDLGFSMQYPSQRVSSIILAAFPTSFALGSISLIAALIASICLASLYAYTNSYLLRALIQSISSVWISTPGFILAALLQFFFAMHWDLLPVARLQSPAHWILPCLSLSLLPCALMTKILSARLLEEKEAPHVLYARAMGLEEKKIFFHYVLRNSVSSLLAYLGLLSANILTGSFVIEKIYAIAGLGQWFVESIEARDYSMIMGLSIFYSSILLSCFMLSELAQIFFNPRLKDKLQDP